MPHTSLADILRGTQPTEEPQVADSLLDLIRQPSPQPLALDAPQVGFPAEAPEEGSKFRDFALRLGARPNSLLGALSAAFGQGTEEIAERKRRQLETRLADQQRAAAFQAAERGPIIEDIEGRKRFSRTGEAVFPEAQAPQDVKAFTNVSEFAPGKFGGINPVTRQFEEIKTTITAETAKQLDFKDKKDKRSFEQTSKLIDSAKKDKRINDFLEVTTKFDRVETAADTPAGDISLIFAFMKMLDPTSVVREGEFATAQNSGSVPDNIQSAYNRALTGERLIPERRLDFKTQATAIFNRSQQTADKALRPIEKRAQKRGLDANTIREQIFGVEADVPSALQGASGQEGQTATEDATGRKFVFRNGKWQTQ